MAAADLAARARRANRRAFGQVVTYRPVVGLAFELEAIYTGEHARRDLAEMGLSTGMPVIDVDLDDFAVPPAQGDTVEVGEVTWRVADIRPDGDGGALLDLRLSLE
ncbi:head-tail joining protein [Oceanibacterium hippocampi]|uniref:Phage head-tail joining protein n=1 Tax=Oceanibacterium hippocampi TaxID=745714 RepID=A0A1Y5TZK7_9PROT|nr:hypothetical protein [Oceanibacterium hippocampi]SLN77591.1 hypothetical protein OCH7691_04472 [Oceanibacterium hippocampi]